MLFVFQLRGLRFITGNLYALQQYQLHNKLPSSTIPVKYIFLQLSVVSVEVSAFMRAGMM